MPLWRIRGRIGGRVKLGAEAAAATVLCDSLNDVCELFLVKAVGLRELKEGLKTDFVQIHCRPTTSVTTAGFISHDANTVVTVILRRTGVRVSGQVTVTTDFAANAV